VKVRLRHPGWIPTLAAIVGLGITLSAAYWQFGRAASKEQLQQDYQASQSARPLNLETQRVSRGAEIIFRKVTASGIYLDEHTIYLDNRTRDGVAGYEVVSPLRLSDGSATVLVNRGWIRGAAERSTLPKVDTPATLVKVTGTAMVPSDRILELSAETVEGVVWQNLVLSRYEQVHGLNVMDFVIQQEDALDDGLDRRWTPPGFGVRTHQSYAVQWLLFATLIIIFYVYYGFLRRKPEEPASK
jgi:surfeit locus 1 family protein